MGQESGWSRSVAGGSIWSGMGRKAVQGAPEDAYRPEIRRIRGWKGFKWIRTGKRTCRELDVGRSDPRGRGRWSVLSDIDRVAVGADRPLPATLAAATGHEC